MKETLVSLVKIQANMLVEKLVVDIPSSITASSHVKYWDIFEVDVEVVVIV